MQQKEHKPKDSDGGGHDGDGNGDIQCFDHEWLLHGEDPFFFYSISGFLTFLHVPWK